MAWWPRQTPRSGSPRPAAARIAAGGEPLHPRCHFQVGTAGGGLQLRVIVGARMQQLGGNAHQPLRALHVLRQRQFDHGTADAAVAVFKRVHGLEPQVRQRGAGQAVDGALAGIEPLQPRSHVGGHVGR